MLERFYGVGDAVEHLAELLSFSVPGAADEEGVAGVAVGAPPMPAGAPREDRQRWEARQALTLDAARPQAVAKRHALGMRTARENIADLCDDGSFLEYGALAVAAQRQRRKSGTARRYHAPDCSRRRLVPKHIMGGGTQPRQHGAVTVRYVESVDRHRNQRVIAANTHQIDATLLAKRSICRGVGVV